MRSHFARDVGPALRLGEDERALQNRLRVKRKALCCPVADDAIFFARHFDVCFERRGMAEDAGFARRANIIVCSERFLHERAGEACELGRRAFEQGCAEIDISEHAVERVSVLVVGRGFKQRAGCFRPMARRGDSQRILARKVMEEGALGDARRAAKVVDAGGRVAVGADESDRGVQELGAGVALRRRVRCRQSTHLGVHTNRLVSVKAVSKMAGRGWLTAC